MVHPLSIFGLYPYSYPSAVPFLLSGISQSTGLSMELTIFLLAIVIGLLGMFGAYLMAKEIKDNPLFVFLVAFTFSTAPALLSATRWATSSRGLFVALLPIFIFCLLRYHKCKKEKKYVILMIILLITLATVHRMALLVIPIFLAYFAATTIHRVSAKVTLPKEILLSIFAMLFLGVLTLCAVAFTGSLIPLVLLVFVAYFLSVALRRLDKPLRAPVIVSFVLMLLFIYAFFIQFSNLEFYKGVWSGYQSKYLFSGSDATILILNMLIYYIGLIGILLIFAVVGIILILFRSKKDFSDWFILFTILFLTPLLGLRMYTAIFLLPFFSILSAIGITEMVKTKKIRKYALPMVIACLLVSLSFSGFMINYWDTKGYQHGDPVDTIVMRDETYSASIFLKEYCHGAFISNSERDGYRITVFSDTYLFPGRNAWLLTYGFVDDVDIIGLSEFTLSMDYIYLANNTVQKDYNTLLTLDCDNATAKEILSEYSICYYVENSNMQSKDVLFRSIREKRYKIYDDGVQSIWYIGRSC